MLLNQSCRVSVYKPPQCEQLVSPAGVISSEAHPFVTHYSACPPPLSPTSGPTGLPQHTWFWSFCLTSRVFKLAAPTETEPDGSKAGKRALISKEEKKRNAWKCVSNIPAPVGMVLAPGTSLSSFS